MLTAIQVKPDVYWVGAIDWNAREFHGYTTEAGITYNSYLILDEKVTLIDTTKAIFHDEFIERISSIIDPSKIDILVANHCEMDHSGNTPALAKLNPNLQIYCSAPQGVKFFEAHYGELNYHGVKTGDTLNIGKRTLSFITTPMVHWPDNMVTLDAEDKILFTNDAFGQHYATSTRFDDQNDLGETMHQARKYYANICQPYRLQAANAVKAVMGIRDQFDMIAPAHGLIWRSHVDEILDAYQNEYASGALKEKAVVIYDTMWKSTDKIAHAITDVFMEKGIPCKLMDLKENHYSDVMTDFLDAKYVCIGSPTLNSQMLPTVAEFMTYMKGLSPKNETRIGIPFGSYGWAPAGPKNVESEMASVGFQLPVGCLSCQWIPSDEDIAKIKEQVASAIA